MSLPEYGEAIAHPELPSYESAAVAASAAHTRDDDGPLGPATFFVAGRFIHPGDPSAPPVYELSHMVHTLKDSDASVELKRLDHTVKAIGGGAPQATTRPRDLFHLKHPQGAAGWSAAFPFHAEPARRSALGAMGLTPTRAEHGRWRIGRTREFRVSRVVRGAGRLLEEREVLFQAAPGRGGGVGFEWTDAEGRLIAREVEDRGYPSLVVTAEMSATLRDALVAAWMLRVWHMLAGWSVRDVSAWDDVKRVFSQKDQDLSGFTTLNRIW